MTKAFERSFECLLKFLKRALNVLEILATDVEKAFQISFKVLVEILK